MGGAVTQGRYSSRFLVSVAGDVPGGVAPPDPRELRTPKRVCSARSVVRPMALRARSIGVSY
jgi:hypothetical protein